MFGKKAVAPRPVEVSVSDGVRYNVYSVYDRVDCCHGDLVIHRSDARAVKTLREQIDKRNATLKAQMGDNATLIDINELELHKIGTWIDVTGVLEPITPYLNIPLNG